MWLQFHSATSLHAGIWRSHELWGTSRVFSRLARHLPATRMCQTVLFSGDEQGEQMKIAVPSLFALASVVMMAGCGGSSSVTAPSQTSAASEYSSNIAGTWTGTTTLLGGALTVRATVVQPNSTSAAAPNQALTGSVLLVESGVTIGVSGTKSGNTWTLSGASASANPVTIRINQTLTGPSASTGTFYFQTGAITNQSTTPLNMLKP